MSGRNIKPALLLTYLTCDWKSVFERICSLGPSSALLLFFGLYGLLAGSLFAAAFAQSAKIRVPVVVTLTISSILLQSYESVIGGVLDYNAFATMASSSGAIRDAIMLFFGDALRESVPVGLLLLSAIALPFTVKGLPAKIALGSPLFGLSLLSAIFYMRGGEGGRALPTPFPLLA